MTPAEWYARGIRVLGRTAVECTRDPLALQQHFAVRAMQLGVERTVTRPLGDRQRFVEAYDGAVEIARSPFRLAGRKLQERHEKHSVLLSQEFEPATHVREPIRGSAARRLHAVLEARPGQPANL